MQEGSRENKQHLLLMFIVNPLAHCTYVHSVFVTLEDELVWVLLAFQREHGADVTEQQLLLRVLADGLKDLHVDYDLVLLALLLDDVCL